MPDVIDTIMLQVLTNELENITNATVIGLSVVPALPPPPPSPPVIPPSYENSTDEEGDPVIIVTTPVAPLPPLVVEQTNNTEKVSIEFVIPADMRVTMEPHPQVGTLICHSAGNQLLA